MQKLLLRYNIWIFLIILVAVPSIIGISHSGFFATDDGNWMVIRFSAFYEALRHGEFPVRFLPRLLNGYGYPVSDFLYPLFMYLGVPIHIVGINFVNTIKIIFGLSMIGSGIFTFLWLKKIFGNIPAIFGAATYVYFPYHLFDLYKRGSVGEILALCIVPCICWQIERKSVFWISIGIGLLILAHNTLAIMILPFLLVYYFIRQKNVKHLVVTTILGLAFSAFFWLPALVDKQYTVFDSKTIANINQYFLGVNNWYIFGLVGVGGIIGGVLGVIKRNTLAMFFAIVLVISLFLATPVSHFLWQILPLGKFVQFPFRFLSLSILASSYLFAYGYSLLKKNYTVIGGLVIGILLLISSLPVLFPSNYQTYPDSWYSTNQDSTTVQNEYLPIWVTGVPTDKSQIVQLVKGQGNIVNQSQQGSKISVQASIVKDAILQINTIYFPGWVVTVDGKKVSIVYADTYGLMQIGLTPGTHIVSAKFTETPVRFLADIVSIFALISLGVYAFWEYKNK